MAIDWTAGGLLTGFMSMGSLPSGTNSEGRVPCPGRTPAGAGLRNRTSVVGWYPPFDPEPIMRQRPDAQDALHARLLHAIDWVHCTGWPTREGDVALAMEVFDVWCAAAPQRAGATGPEDHEALAEALLAVFAIRYGDEAARHLTTILTLSLELHWRTRHPGSEGDPA